MAAADIGEGGAEGEGKGGRCGDAEVLLCSPMCCFTCFIMSYGHKWFYIASYLLLPDIGRIELDS